MSQKFVLYLAGGGMAGAFGGGIVTGIAKHGLAKNVEAVYSTSAGAFNGAYFLANQTKMGLTVYLDDLTKRFIQFRKIPKSILQIFFPKLFSKKNMESAIDIDYLMDVVTTKKILNIKKIKKSRIPLFVKLLNLNTRKVVYADVRSGNTLQKLKAAVSIVPYWHSPEKIGRNRYIDGALAEPIGLERIMKTHPGKKIVVALNLHPGKNFWMEKKWILEGLMSKGFGSFLTGIFKKGADSFRNDMEIVKKSTQILFLHPASKSHAMQWTTDKKMLLKSFKEGLKNSVKIKRFVLKERAVKGNGRQTSY